MPWFHGMSLFYLHPDDRRWLKRWFRNNLVCFAAIVGFLLLLRISSAIPLTTSSDASSAVAPEGWRRTNRGWEHTSNWHLTRHDEMQYAGMPGFPPTWATMTMETVRNTSPLVITLAQLAAIGMIVRFSNRRRSCSA